MKQTIKKRPVQNTSSGIPAVWMAAGGALAALIAVWIAYSPALHGPFLFDDAALPFGLPTYPTELKAWIGAVRPFLMLTYWVNFNISREDTFGYHAFNVLFHWGAGLIFFIVVRKLLEIAGTLGTQRNALAAIATAIFLLHPAQSEAVAYIAGRPDALSMLFLLAAYAVFLTRPQPSVSWTRAAAVLALFLLSLFSKEQGVALIPLLLLTDFWWNPGFSFTGIRDNWKLYAPVFAGGAAGIAALWHVIVSSPTAGFAMKDFTWYQYLFTQCRSLLVYLRLLVLPYGQTIDYDFPISKSLFEHGAIFGGAVLVAIGVLAWIWRKRYPLGAFGWFAFLVLMAPTSSILPIKDPIAERRMYMGMLGLLLIVLEALRQVKLERRALTAVLAIVSVLGLGLTYARANVWSGSIELWEDAVAKSPTKVRPHFQLASAYYREGRCDVAVQQFELAAKLEKPNYDLLLDWGLAYDCLNNADAAIAKMKEAAQLEPVAHVYTQMGMVYAKRQRWGEATEALAIAERADPNYAVTYVYKGGVHLSTGDAASALKDYQRALALEPTNQQAQEGLAMAQQALAGAAK